jgi:hypothetical protein
MCGETSELDVFLTVAFLFLLHNINALYKEVQMTVISVRKRSIYSDRQARVILRQVF